MATINKNVPTHIRNNRGRNLLAAIVKDDKAAVEALRREGFKDIDSEVSQLKKAYFDEKDPGHKDAVDTMQGLYQIVNEGE
jgi:hypothetical protein